MSQKNRGKISGTYPKRFPAFIQSEGPMSLLSLQDLLDEIGHVLEKYDCRKTFSVITPKGMGRDEALASIRKGACHITESPRQVEIRIFQEM